MRNTIVTLVLIAAVSCSAPVAWEDDGRLRVTTTTGMIADAARNVGGEHVDVVALMGPGVDPHLYKATQGDLRKLGTADVILYNGLMLEGRMQDVFERMARRTRTAAVTDDIPRDLLLTHPDYEGEYDPHVWFDVSLWIYVVEKIRGVLSEEDPDNAADYAANAAAFIEELEALHEYVGKAVAAIPEESRVLVTAHDAFGYFGRAYGIEVEALQGISTAAEYGLQDVRGLVDLLTGRNVKAVFIETSISPRSVQALVEGAKARGHDVRIGGELFSDAMGESGTPEGTYPGMVRYNVDTIVEALK